MYFFFPFAAEPAAAPASQKLPQYKALPMLPTPRDTPGERSGSAGFGGAIAEVGNMAVELLRRALTSLATSLTALGSRANAFFAQLAAALAFDRAARDTAASFGMSWPPFGQPLPQTGFATGPWFAPLQAPFQTSPFGVPGFSTDSLSGNPWAPFTEAFESWTSLWMPAPAPQRRTAPSSPARSQPRSLCPAALSASPSARISFHNIPDRALLPCRGSNSAGTGEAE